MRSEPFGLTVRPCGRTQIAQIVLRTLNQQIVQTYLENLYLSVSTIHDQLGKAADGAARLADGADKLKTAAAQLSSGSGKLADGLGDAQRQASGATAPLRQLPAPAPGPLAGVASQFERLATGLEAAAGGANQVHNGARQLEGGVGQLSDGAHQLASQLAQGRDQVPVYSPAELERLKNVAATPAVAITDNTNIGAAVAAVAVTLALWACALGTYVITRAVPAAVLTSRERTATIVARTALNQAVTAIFKRPGRYASIAVLVIALVTSLMSTIPSALHTIGSYLPTHSAILGLRGVIVGSDVAATGVAQLAAWFAAGALATTLITEQRRVLGSKQLRLGSVLSPAT